MTIRVHPIRDGDVRGVAEFLHTHMNSRVPADVWMRSFDVPWTVDKPNNGFMLLDEDTIVGAYTAYYSERTFDVRTEHMCDLGTWCVLPDYRLHSLRLLKALLAQDGYHFTDLSPSEKVVAINERLGFRSMNTTTVLIPTLPWPWRSGRHSVTTDPLFMDRTLAGRDLQLYRDHAGASAARHLVLTRGDQWCYVVFRMDRFKKLPSVFASILHVSNPALFREMVLPLSGYLLVNHRALAMLAELRITRSRPRLSIRVPSPRRKMFLSPTLSPDQIDYFYSELALVSW